MGATGSPRGGSDRAVQAGARAGAGAAQGFGGRGRLDATAPPGLARWEAPRVDTLQEGPPVSRAAWQVPRPGAPRAGVRVAPPAGQRVGAWGPPTGQDVWEAPAWPRGARAPQKGRLFWKCDMASLPEAYCGEF